MKKTKYYYNNQVQIVKSRYLFRDKVNYIDNYVEVKILGEATRYQKVGYEILSLSYFLIELPDKTRKEIDVDELFTSL